MIKYFCDVCGADMGNDDSNGIVRFLYELTETRVSVIVRSERLISPKSQLCRQCCRNALALCLTEL